MNAQFQIVEYDEFRAKLDEIVDTCNFIPDLTTDEGYEKSKRVSLDVGKVITRLESVRQDKKSYFLNGGREVDAQAAAIKEVLEGARQPHKEAYKSLDALKKQREEERKAKLHARVKYMQDLPDSLRDSDSVAVLAAMEEMNAEECQGLYEFTEAGLLARNSARQVLGEMYVAKQKAEKEAAELAEFRRLAAIKEQEEREALIAKEAAEKAMREAEEKARAEREAAIRREAEAKEAAEKRELELKQAAERAERDKAEAQRRAEQAERDAAARAEAAAQAERQRQADEQARAEAEARAREADKAHKKSVNNAALADLVAGGLTKECAKQAITLIAQGKVSNVRISY